jgi:hypothetical protein
MELEEQSVDLKKINEVLFSVRKCGPVVQEQFVVSTLCFTSVVQ